MKVELQWPLWLNKQSKVSFGPPLFVSLLVPPELLFPVCNPKPEKGESCWNHPNLLMDMLAWDQEGPRDHCPCADDLQCIPRG